jgi:hypothetical protein
VWSVDPQYFLGIAHDKLIGPSITASTVAATLAYLSWLIHLSQFSSWHFRQDIQDLPIFARDSRGRFTRYFRASFASTRARAFRAMRSFSC